MWWSTFRMHTGQIILLTKMLTGEDLGLLPASSRLRPGGQRAPSLTHAVLG